MKLYLLTRTDNYGYDQYDSFVIAEINKSSARELARNYNEGCWASYDSDVTIKEIGEAGSDVARGVVLGSFNAG